MNPHKLPGHKFKLSQKVKKFAEKDLQMPEHAFIKALPLYRAYNTLPIFPTNQISQSNLIERHVTCSAFAPLNDYLLNRNEAGFEDRIEQDIENIQKSVLK